ncbi:LysR family transcriptional regulator (plasmid) [Bradyrhizobium sp. 186]|uniref:LysR substrate-binding domain-containing protein n=1 Tax=Bradyrhizobium sp. 186 TaxID=2782654 RepID=UPI002001702F|nr:LysR substrate-binding domain-containing protein [Bradyrhizobium sp. 186]UPK41010.1 LysR family transcriptional regulator [Bradyrhizobium sp. 186]
MSTIASIRHLSALRAFEVAARLLSFHKAAQELNLTPSAVSHQIRRLELELGQRLFVRESRSVRLTPAGETLRGYTLRGFSELSRGVSAIVDTAASSELRVSVAPAFAARYLTARVAEFERSNPKLKLNLDVSQPLIDLTDGEFHAAVRLGYGGGPGLHSEILARVTSALVCSEALASKIANVDDLRNFTRIVVTQLSHEWDTWYEAMGKNPIKPNRSLRFTPMLDGIQAAIDGIGVTIAPIIIIEKHLRDGRLVMPFEQTFDSKASYLLLCRKGEETSHRIMRLRSWINRMMQE